MKQFVAGVIVTATVLGATGFAVMKEPAAAKKIFPLRLNELTLDRAFRITVPVPPTLTVVPASPTQGMVITNLSSGEYGAGDAAIFISVNGGLPERVPCGLNTYNQSIYSRTVIDPPIVVRPGDTLTVSQNYVVNNFSNITFGGYFVYPGEV